jgi:Zn-finger nucleic acid-binding protein
MGRLERADVGEVHLEQCARCMGCFLRTEDFSQLVDFEESGQHVTLSSFVPTDGRALPRQTLLALVHCPHCPREMDRARFDQRAEIVIDVCPTHGMWLDAGELPMVLDYVHQRASGHVSESAAAREENAHWDRVDQTLANEARIVDGHIANATPQASGSAAGVVIATAALGPWAGLFVALRNMNKR